MTATPRSPLADLAGELAAAGSSLARVREIPFLPQFSSRGTPPVAPGTWAGDHFWLGPDEWLTAGAQAAGDVDVSDQRTVLELAGPATRELLETGCALDLHPSAFGPGRCAQTNLARCNVILAQRDDAPAYWLFVRASFAAYLARWITDALGGLR